MKLLYMLLLLSILATGCGLTEKTYPYIKPSPTSTQTTTSPQTNTPTMTATPTWIPTASPTITLTRTPTSTKTPYPSPEGVLTNSELQQKVNDWIDGKIILNDADRLLSESSGQPLRLGVLVKPSQNIPPWNDAILIFYNLGFTIIENEHGIPFILNIVGFEDGKGERFTFPLHNGRLLKAQETIYFGEAYGKWINREKFIFLNWFSPLQFVQKSAELIDYVNLGTTTVGTYGKSNEEDQFIRSADETVNDLIQFLDCNQCSLQDIPKSLEKYINQIPEKFEPAIPYFWVYTVAY